jgi:CheY-like chemotaxis protein
MKLSEAMPPRPLRLLLIDDNPGEAPLVRAAIQDLGLWCELEAVTESDTAVGLLQKRATTAPDVILLDINMPKLDGYAVLEKIREHPTLRLLPVIMFSGSRNPDEVARAYQLGANAFVVKPMGSYREVVRRIHSFWYSCASLPTVAEAAAA